MKKVYTYLTIWSFILLSITALSFKGNIYFGDGMGDVFTDIKIVLTIIIVNTIVAVNINKITEKYRYQCVTLIFTIGFLIYIILKIRFLNLGFISWHN